MGSLTRENLRRPRETEDGVSVYSWQRAIYANASVIASAAPVAGPRTMLINGVTDT